jgi:hypothetical protein
MDGSKYATRASLRKLEAWACSWYDEAVEAEFINASYHPDTATLDRLRGYFKAGLSPAEAVDACFRGRH